MNADRVADFVGACVVAVLFGVVMLVCGAPGWAAGAAAYILFRIDRLGDL